MQAMARCPENLLEPKTLGVFGIKNARGGNTVRRNEIGHGFTHAPKFQIARSISPLDGSVGGGHTPAPTGENLGFVLTVGKTFPLPVVAFLEAMGEKLGRLA